MRVEIDGNAGFCGGVVRAVSRAEELLDKGETLFSLGAIVHNEEELLRLEGKGLVTMDRDDIEEIRQASGRKLLIRAHGIPPQVYSILDQLGFNIIDCTCPVVLALQKKIRESYAVIKSQSAPGSLVIFGKIGHPEVLGLVGQVDGDAVVVESLDQLKELVAQGGLDVCHDIALFSQTTMSPQEYANVKIYLEDSMHEGAMLHVHDTICRQVESRHRELADFARHHDVIVFVAGKSSSNGKVLCELCREVNLRTYHIGGEEDLQKAWFRPDDLVGISGATSTPKWLLENVAAAVENLQ